MNNKNNLSSPRGVGPLSLMFLIFMTLKLMGYITWSWWWVTAPLWGGLVLITLIIVLAIIFNKLLRLWKQIIP